MGRAVAANTEGADYTANAELNPPTPERLRLIR